MTEKLVYSVNEVAGLLDLAPGSVYKACRDGQIPCLVIGKRVVIPIARFNRYLNGESGAQLDRLLEGQKGEAQCH